MKNSILLSLGIIIMAASSSIGQIAVDFQTGANTESGFTGITTSSATSLGSGVSIELSSVSFRDRGTPADAGSFTLGDLYRDLIFAGGAGTITIDFTGLALNQQYDAFFYVYDDAATGQTDTTITNTVGSGGSTVVNWDGSVAPASNTDYTGSFVTTSTALGELSFTVSSALVTTGGTNNGTIAGITLTAVPEPTTGIMAILGLLTLFGVRRFQL